MNRSGNFNPDALGMIELCPPITVQIDGTECAIGFYFKQSRPEFRDYFVYCNHEAFLSENNGCPLFDATASEAWSGMHTVCMDCLGWPELHAVRFADRHMFSFNRPAWAANRRFPSEAFRW